jgi:predicted AAA+ superfamily ATPase
LTQLFPLPGNSLSTPEWHTSSRIGKFYGLHSVKFTDYIPLISPNQYAGGMAYQERVIDAQLRRALKGAGAVVLEGPKACGKTTTASQLAASVVRLDRDRQAREVGLANPDALLAGDVPRLIDEWQLVPEVWNAVRGAVDDRRAPGQFILTGSATPADDQTRHSGAMRFLRLELRPMSLHESGESSGAACVSRLWQGETPPPSIERAELEQLAEAAARGGWPGILDLDKETCLALNRSYLRSIAAGDIITVDGIRRDPQKVAALLGALGRNTGTYVTNRVLQTDSAEFGQLIDPTTIAAYLDALVRLWVLVPQHAWGGHLRSSAAARKAPKRHLVDPSLAVAAMEAEPADLLRDRAAFGQVFETLVFRDLSVYAQAADLSVRAFQDSKGNEIDAVLTKGTQWAGVEVKLSAIPEVVDAAAAKLLALAGRMTSEPQFLAIVTADGPTYTRPDGVHVIGITQLGP